MAVDTHFPDTGHPRRRIEPSECDIYIRISYHHGISFCGDAGDGQGVRESGEEDIWTVNFNMIEIHNAWKNSLEIRKNMWYIVNRRLQKCNCGLVARPRSYLIGGETPRHLIYISGIKERRIENH